MGWYTVVAQDRLLVRLVGQFQVKREKRKKEDDKLENALSFQLYPSNSTRHPTLPPRLLSILRLGWMVGWVGVRRRGKGKAADDLHVEVV